MSRKLSISFIYFLFLNANGLLSRRLSVRPRKLCSRDWMVQQRLAQRHVCGMGGKDRTDETTTTSVDASRRQLWLKSASRIASVGLVTSAIWAWSRPVFAKTRSRTDGYPVQESEEKWKETLSPIQYEILRQGGTERPYFSILEKEKRTGIYRCAACDTALFASSDKFISGTGWPSFARALDGVETESVDAITANLSGAELRCKTCGGHLGDVFNDGFLFVGTEAFKTGKRYCIDGVALVFYPDSGEEPLRGDVPARA